MNKIKVLKVFMEEDSVGTMALYEGRYGAFEYDDDWIEKGFSISPFSLPLEKKVFIPKWDPFDGLFGVFEDSLPDGWGRLLVDRMLLRQRQKPYDFDGISRLAIVGKSGMGALRYQPVYDFKMNTRSSDLDKLAEECKKMLLQNDSEDLDELFYLGGSSGGARPKILTQYKDEEWIIKFSSSQDPEDVGEMEYHYANCARICGIEVMETKLFPSKICNGYFGTKRFDRKTEHGKIHKVHMISVAGLLETSHRIPNLDYNGLMKLTYLLTKDYGEVEKMYRLLCFNVFAHNRDDHSKNFSFLFDKVERHWKLSPAYDLTYSNSIRGEHATMVNGNGSSPGEEDILAVADNIGLGKERSKKIMREIKDIVTTEIIDRYKKLKF